LTGRTPLWADAIKLIAERPLTGHGFQIIYHEFGRTYFPHIDSTWFQPHPHNTYLHIAAQLGLPALGLMVIFALVTLYRAFVVFSAQWSAFGLFASGYLMLYCVVNVSGSWMLEAFQFEWVVFIALATALARRTEPVPRPVRARARATASRPAAS
jgi:O-antigen ligase